MTLIVNKSQLYRFLLIDKLEIGNYKVKFKLLVDRPHSRCIRWRITVDSNIVFKLIN